MAYVLLSEVRDRIQKTDVDATGDAVITALIGAIELSINRFCNRPDGFEAVEATRYFPGSGKSFTLIDETVDITSVAVKDSPTDATYAAWTSPTTNMAGDGDWFAFTGDPQWPDYNSLPWTALRVDPNGNQSRFTSGMFRDRESPRRRGSLQSQVPTVRVVAYWGYSFVAPANVREACAFMTAIAYKRFQGSGASVLATNELGELEMFRTLDPFAEYLLRLGRYIRPETGRA